MAALPVTEDKRELVYEISYKDLTWVYIEKPTEREAKYLGQKFPSFHHLNLEDIVSKIQLPKIDEYDDHLFIVLHFPVFNKEARITTPSEVDIFVGNGFVVTVHCCADLKPLASLFKECQISEESRQVYLGGGSGYLLYRIIDRLVDYCFPMLNKIIENVDKIEDKVLSRLGPEMVRETMTVRRDLLSFRHVIRLEMPVIQSLEEKERRFLKKEKLELYFGDINDHLQKIWNTLEEYREVTEVLTDTSNWLTSHRIQEVMRVLTIVMAIMMPLTVITGFYGMNIRLPLGIASEGSWQAFIVLIIVMVIVTSGMLFLFHRRRWI